MTNQTKLRASLGGSLAGLTMSRICPITLAAVLATCGAVSGRTQENPKPEAAKPAAESKPAAKSAAENKPANGTEGKTVGNYQVHQMIELGGRIANKSGSDAMWATMVNQTSGFRVLSQSLEMHSTNTAKTPFFDVLTTNSYGYGGDPYDATYFNASKGRWWDFAASFRRDRNYFDYNPVVQPYLTTATATNPVLVPTPSTLHLYNTVRYNTDTLLTLFPVSRFHVRVGYNHGTHEGPAFTSLHNGGDVPLAQWFRNSLDTYLGGVDVNVLKRTTLSYDQFLGFYRGDTSWQLAPTPFVLPNKTPVSLGVTVLTGPGVTCGSGAFKTINVVNGVANPFCSGTIQQSWASPSRTHFPTEQFRFVSHYWDRIGMNGRVTYSGGVNDINHFNETFNGLVTRTSTRAEVFTGGLANGRLAENKRINVNADYGVDAEITKFLSVSDVINYWDFRIPGMNTVTSQVWAYPSGTTPPPTFSMLTPLSQVPMTTTTTTNTGYLSQKNLGNTILASVTVTPEFRFSGGWRFNNREIKFGGDDTLAWHQNWALVGAVFQPSQVLRFNIDYEGMSSSSANSATPTNTYTREMPNSIEHIRVRAIVRPESWVNFAVAYNGYGAKNTDPLVNHIEHNHDFSFAAQVIPIETLTLDFNYSHDDLLSQTDLCYQFTANPQAPLPPGATNAGTCTAANGGSSSFYLGNGYYHAPVNFFIASGNWAPSKYFAVNAGFRETNTSGSAELWNPLMVPAALDSKVIDPYTDLQVRIASQWWWHGNWQHQAYTEGSVNSPILPGREFHGDIFTLGVKYAF